MRLSFSFTQPSFSNAPDRNGMSYDRNFTYAHFQIGNGHTSGRNRSVGYATVGGIRYGNNVYYAVALCSPADNFSKGEGRKRVLEHLSIDEHSKKRGIVEMDESFLDSASPTEVFKIVLMHHLRKSHNLPPWTRQVVLHRRGCGKTTTTEQNVIPDNDVKTFGKIIGSVTHDSEFKVVVRQQSRHQAALRGWETRRSRAAALKGWETRRIRQSDRKLDG